MKKTTIGGQAVMEGIMMKNKDSYAVAVRKANQEIVVEHFDYKNLGEKISFFGLPIIRGVVNFVESLVLGTKTLIFSANLIEIEEESEQEAKQPTEENKGIFTGFILFVTVCISILLSVGLFMVIPFLLTNLFHISRDHPLTYAIFEGGFRLTIFALYIFAISRMKDIQRVFMYHGAEHKTINCLEAGEPLTVNNIKKHSRLHKRCGTSFLLIVMVISILFFMFIKTTSFKWRLVSRLLMVPPIAGVSYEFIRFAGKTDSKIMNILSKPGMLLQKLTTKEPDDSMIEVAIKSVEAVLNWEKYITALNNGELEN